MCQRVIRSLVLLMALLGIGLGCQKAPTLIVPTKKYPEAGPIESPGGGVIQPSRSTAEATAPKPPATASTAATKKEPDTARPKP